MTSKYIAYYRVSTKQQGQSGLGLEAQQAAVRGFTGNCKDCIVAEVTEIETGTSKRVRTKILEAIELAKKHNAILLIAKLDRLARNVHFVSSLMESKVAFKACDMPEADNFTIHIFAALAEREAKLISERTKAALEAKKARGEKVNRISNLTEDSRQKGRVIQTEKAYSDEAVRRAAAMIKMYRNQGLSFEQIAQKLNQAAFKTRKNKPFAPMQVYRIFKRAINEASK
jgi:DNA invertase Pin-like site-specific DNA recombinase